MKFSTLSLPTILLLVTIVAIARATEVDSPSELQKYFESDLDDQDGDDGWMDVTAGLMMKKDGGQTLAKRSQNFNSREKSEILVARDPESHRLSLPTNWQEASQMVKRDIPGTMGRHFKRAQELVKRMSVKITWYTGHDLLNPSCAQTSGWAPSDSSLAAAVTIQWAGKPGCGKFVKIAHKTKPKVTVVVRIVDSCGGCAADSAHIDLTQAAFQKLYNLDVGQVEGLKAKIVKAPKGHKWTQKDINTYGPKKL